MISSSTRFRTSKGKVILELDLLKLRLNLNTWHIAPLKRNSSGSTYNSDSNLKYVEEKEIR